MYHMPVSARARPAQRQEMGTQSETQTGWWRFTYLSHHQLIPNVDSRKLGPEVGLGLKSGHSVMGY